VAWRARTRAVGSGVRLRTDCWDGAALDRGTVGPARHVAPGGDSALTSGSSVVREKLTGGTPR
jgi:hypothetical protein